MSSEKRDTEKYRFFSVYTFFYLNGLSIVKSLWSWLIFFFNVVGAEQFWKLFHGKIKFKFCNTVSPRIACIHVQKIHRAIRNLAFWICTRIWVKIRAIVKSHYLNPHYSRNYCSTICKWQFFFSTLTWIVY